MSGPQSDRGGVVVIRVWLEEDAGRGGFRARIISTADVDGSDQEVTAVASLDAALEVVRQRLAAIVADRRPE